MDCISLAVDNRRVSNDTLGKAGKLDLGINEFVVKSTRVKACKPASAGSIEGLARLHAHGKELFIGELAANIRF
jgi:hypothetical protein